MWKEAVVGTSIIFYLMIGVGIVGIAAKSVNYFTLRKMVKAAGNMSKSTHKLMKLVRAKYEHACMIHDRVDNVDAFVEKYIYEYRGVALRIHTWRQIEIQSIWVSGILGALGATAHFMENGFCEQVYQYVAFGLAEMVALFVISQITDESYKIEAAKNYMVDYLENVCSHKFKRVRQNDKNLDVIRPEATVNQKMSGAQKASKRAAAAVKEQESELSIRIEGEPRQAAWDERENAQQNGQDVQGQSETSALAMDTERGTGKSMQRTPSHESDEPSLKEEAIRQILEEFLA